MGRCLYIDERGKHCRRNAEPGYDFCYLHDRADIPNKASLGRALRKTLFRLAAGILLLIFVLEGYQLLKALLSP